MEKWHIRFQSGFKTVLLRVFAFTLLRNAWLEYGATIMCFSS